jgi:PAS domain S-box-containing protein
MRPVSASAASPPNSSRSALIVRGAAPAISFMLALLVTGALVLNVSRTIERKDRAAFENDVASTLEAIRQRIDTAMTLLRGTAGLFAASVEVDRNEFRAYVESLELRAQYPGILGIGFTRAMRADEVAAVEAWMHAQGDRSFHVWPDEPKREELNSILFLEPLDDRNRAAIGYDMSTHPVRRAAMAAARSSGRTTASGPVTLVQEIDEQKQAGFLLYAPVYANLPGIEALPPAERPLLGYAYSPLRVGDLLAGVRGRRAMLDFEVYDGDERRPEALLRERMQPDPRPPRFTAAEHIDVAGRRWLLQFSSLPSDTISQRWLVPWLFVGALITSLLLAWISVVQLRAHRVAERTARAERLAAAALHREREWLRATLTSIGDGVVVIDADGRIVLMNPVAERLTGWSAAAARGQSFDEVVVVADLAENDAAPGETGRGEVLLRARGGDTCPVDHSSAPIRDQFGAVSGAVMVMRDATERHRVEAELRANDRRKDEFLAMLAHELRNPLAPICNSLELLRRQPDGPQAERARAVAQRQAQHMVRLIDDLLDLSRISRGKIALQRQPMSLAAALEAAVESSRPLIQSRQHRLRVEAVDPLLRVDGDHTRLAQVFANLLNNAATYTEPGGEIVVTAERDDGWVQIVVRDSGIGIAAEHLPHVFDMFVQANRSVERSGGLGIGLTLVQQLVQMHGGTVEARSAGIGTGSAFVVRLPLLRDRQPPDETTRPTRAASAQQAHPLHILVVDDNRDAADSLALMLRLDGHEVDLAYDGPQALQKAGESMHEVLLLDIGLPGINGYEVARRVREQAAPERQPTLVAITGWGQDSDRRRAREAGFDHHLVKPIEYRALLAVLADVAHGGTARDGDVRGSA